MTIDRRLDRLMPAFSARERAVLVLRSLKHGTPEDPSWRLKMPRNQAAEFNRLIHLMNACNVYLPLFFGLVEQLAEQLSLRLCWMLTVADLGEAAWDLAGLVPASKQAQAAKLVAEVYPRVDLPWLPEAPEGSWVEFTERGVEALRGDLVGLWRELQAIEAVIGEVADEFGEDPLRPVLRSVVEKTRAKLTELHELLSAVEPFELPAPDAEALRQARAAFQHGCRVVASL